MEQNRNQKTSIKIDIDEAKEPINLKIPDEDKSDIVRYMEERELKKKQEIHFHKVKKELNLGQFEQTIITGKIKQNTDTQHKDDSEDKQGRIEPVYNKIELKDTIGDFEGLIEETLQKHLLKQNQVVEDDMIKKVSAKYKDYGEDIKEMFNFELIKMNNCKLEPQEVK